MTPLTPLDVENRPLRGALRGYDRSEVDHLRAEVAASIEEYLDQIGRQRARLRELEGELARYREDEEALKSAVMLAQRTADELIAAAKQRAAALLEQARLDAEQVRRGVADVAAQREQFEYAFYGLLTGFLQRLEQGNPRLRREQSTAAPPFKVLQAMDTQPEQPEQVPDPPVSIDMEDLTSDEPEDGDGESEPDDTIILPMSAPPMPGNQWQPPAPRLGAAARLDADSVDFTAAVERAGSHPQALAEPQRPISGSPVHETAELQDRE